MGKTGFSIAIRSVIGAVSAFAVGACGGAGDAGAVAGAASPASESIVVVPVAPPVAVVVPAPAPAPPPAASDMLVAPALLAAVALDIPDTVVAPDATVANVHVRLTRAVDRQLAFAYLTANGTAIERHEFTRTQGILIFRPGEHDKVISIPISRVAAGKSFKLTVGWTKNVPAVAGASGTIIGGTATATLAAESPRYALADAAKTTGRREVFASDFRGPVNPAGGLGVWRTRFNWGRWQSGNNEAAPYADATTDPGTNPHPIIDGYRTIRAEKVPTKDGARSFAYSASMLSTHGWYSFQYGYVQLRAKVRPEYGVTPAFWLLPSNGAWPPEIDIFEFLNNAALTSSVHFKNDPQGTMEGMATEFAADGDWHTYGLDWTPDWLITLVDGKEIHRRRNIFHQPMYIIVNTAVGLRSTGPSNADAQWHNDMTLDRIAVYQ